MTTSNKKRQFEAVLGNWPSFIYIPVIRTRKFSTLAAICRNHFVDNFLAMLHSSNGETTAVHVEGSGELHVSLSKPFALRYHHIESFIKRLGEAISSVLKAVCFLPVYREYYVLSNDNASRGFICLPVEDRAKQLGRLIPVIDEVLRSFNQPAYYEDPKFHISVGSFSFEDIDLEACALPMDSHKPIEVSDAFLRVRGQRQRTDDTANTGTTTASTPTTTISISEPESFCRAGRNGRAGVSNGSNGETLIATATGATAVISSMFADYGSSSDSDIDGDDTDVIRYNEVSVPSSSTWTRSDQDAVVHAISSSSSSNLSSADVALVKDRDNTEDAASIDDDDNDSDDADGDDDETFDPLCSSTQVKIGCIECRIGNRLFRMQLPPSCASDDLTLMKQVLEFVEVRTVTKPQAAGNSNGVGAVGSNGDAVKIDGTGSTDSNSTKRVKH